MTNSEPYPNQTRQWIAPAPASPPPRPPEPDSGWRHSRMRHARIACTLVRVVCGLFAAVLVARIVLVIGDANPANGVAALVRGWSNAVSLGFVDLFTPASASWRAFLNYGLAAVCWVGISALTTTLIYRFAAPVRDDDPFSIG